MLTTAVKWVSLAASLLFSGLSWHLPAQTITLLVGLVAWAGILVSLVQSLAMRKYGWATMFGALGIVFNPVLPIFLSPFRLLGVNLFCVTAFATSLMFIRQAARLPIPSIANASARGESL